MKKIALLVILSLFAMDMANAQRREVNRANRQLKRENIERAYEHIQNALEHESTKEDSETWVVYAKVLIEIGLSEDSNVNQLAEKPLDKALESIDKAEDLDEDNSMILDIQQARLVLSEAFFNKGATAYNESEFAEATEAFYNSYQIGESFGSIDTATLYNAGLSAEIAGMYEEAYDMYEEVAEYDYDQPLLYSSLASLSLREEDYDKAEEWIKKGRELYPENLDLIFSEANVYLTSGNIPEARRVLEIAIERDPDNANLHYAFAVNYDQMSKDSLYTEEEREFAYEQAIESYEKAIELKPDYFDAIYNLGALYFNEGIQLFVKADNILREGYSNETLERSAELEKKSKEIWSEDAQPYLERALELIDEDDENYEVVIRSLRELYMRTGQEEKLEEVNKIWQEKFASPEEE